MWCERKGIECQGYGIWGECTITTCALPNAEPSTLGTSSSYSVNTIPENLIYDIKRNAVKEFAEKVKAHAERCYEWDMAKIVKAEVDNVLKEYEV